MEIYNTTASDDRRRKVAAATASVALFGILTGCSDTPEQSSSRNTPSTAAYSVDVNPTYYRDIKDISQFTQDPQILAKLDTLNKTPVAEWLHGSTVDVYDTLQSSLDNSKASGTIPVFVPYNIPHRDINQGSRGGTTTAEDYKDWITDVSQAIDDQPAIVILEPDALSHLSELDNEQAEERLELLATALDTLHDNDNTAVYLDAGNSSWLDPSATAALLKKVEEKTQNGIHGIALNVSNYRPEQETRDFAKAIETAYGQELHVMIDNSRNGAETPVASKEWCNPAGQKLGNIDNTYDSAAKVEVAYIKTPGQSDDACGISDASAGQFDGELLFKQLKE